MDRVVRDHLVPTSSKISCHIPIMAPSTTTTVQFKDRIWYLVGDLPKCKANAKVETNTRNGS